ncbi:MAG: alpha-amylase [Chloroflexi bacterium]|nr:alpha-amylase [Chloroflexota bacterium]
MSKTLIYEINTRVWLNSLSRHAARNVTLDSVPDGVIAGLAALGVTHIWLMGIWVRSSMARKGALRYQDEYRFALPDISPDDVIGSAYSIGKYEVAPEAGGRAGLAAFREAALRHGMKIILDYVPNHVGLDHPWVTGAADLCVRGMPELLAARPDDFFESIRQDGSIVVTAHGRDPYFPPWNDTAQLNAFSHILRQATIATLSDIAVQADGVRCDMAMLMLNEIFATTWGGLVTTPTPGIDFWDEVVPAVRRVNPDFLFIAEVYWDLEGKLIDQGFDYAYDKRLYDRLLSEDVAGLKSHLASPEDFQRHLLRFIENHDEPRAAADFAAGGGAKQKAAAAVCLTLPGAVLLHDGQLDGRRIKLPVQIGRAPDEPHDPALRAYYVRLLSEVMNAPVMCGHWTLLESTGDVLAYICSTPINARLVVANVTGHSQHTTIRLTEYGNHPLVNVMTNQIIAPFGDRLEVDMPAYTTNIYEIELARPAQPTLANRLVDAARRTARWIKGDGPRG